MFTVDTSLTLTSKSVRTPGGRGGVSAGLSAGGRGTTGALAGGSRVELCGGSSSSELLGELVDDDDDDDEVRLTTGFLKFLASRSGSSATKSSSYIASLASRGGRIGCRSKAAMISWMSFFRPSARDAAAALITSRQNLDKMALVSASEILLDKIALVRFCQRDN